MTKYSGQSPIGEGITFGGVRYLFFWFWQS